MGSVFCPVWVGDVFRLGELYSQKHFIRRGKKDEKVFKGNVLALLFSYCGDCCVLLLHGEKRIKYQVTVLQWVSLLSRCLLFF